MKNQNRLAQAASPYLQQHANNPVDWYEWGEEALQKAQNENKILIISIGYSACHWCHVMEAESFMNESVAELMNRYFVSVKVDREERPDIDQIYIEAAQMLNGNAGWPLNVFALPDGKPFFAGTYFPKSQWESVLTQLHQIFTDEPERVKKQAEALTEGIQNEVLLEEKAPENKIYNQADLDRIAEVYLGKVDFEKGGFQSRQKFPMPVNWEFLLQYYGLTEDEKVRKALDVTLNQMAFGGIYDQLGGGFARYAVDPDWFAPHFEKMLYDNAQLVSLYAKFFRMTQDPLYEKVIRETLTFIQREMTSDEGGFYSALNADSEGEEGKFYVWEKSEIEECLNSDLVALFCDFYQVKDEGNWENNQNILYRTQHLDEFAQKHNLSPEECLQKIEEAKQQLLKIRAQRIRPSTDDKILTSWNAMMLKAYIEAYKSLGDEYYLEAALQNASFLTENLWQNEGGLFRSYKNGKATIEAFLDDYAFLAEAFLAVYEVTFDKSYLDKAQQLIQYTLRHFYDKTSGLFYYTSDLSENLIARKKEIIDNVIPSSNAVMAEVVFRLATCFDHKEYLNIAQKMLTKMKSNLMKGGIYFGKWHQVLLQEIVEPYQIAILGNQALEKMKTLQKHFLVNAFILGGNQENLPLLKDKIKVGKTFIYVCQNRVCQAPTESVKEALKQLNKG